MDARAEEARWISRRTLALAALLGALGATATVASGGALESQSGGRSAVWRASVNSSHRGGSRSIYPGSSRQTLPFTITSLRDHEALRGVAASVSSDEASGEARDASGAVIRGCLARWFKVVPDSRDGSLPVTFQHAGATYHGTLDVTMIDAQVDQDACAGQQPAVLVAPSS